MDNIINSQGTRIFVLDKPTSDPLFADCDAAATAILAGKQVLCPQSLGNLEQTRSVQEYKCLSSNDSKKITGAISRGSLDIGMLFDPADTAGQQHLIDAFEKNEPFIVGIEYPDVDVSLGTNGNPHGTIRWFEAVLSREAEIVEMDAAILYEVTAEVSSAITKCPMVAGTA